MQFLLLLTVESGADCHFLGSCTCNFLPRKKEVIRLLTDAYYYSTYPAKYASRHLLPSSLRADLSGIQEGRSKEQCWKSLTLAAPFGQ